MSDPFYSKLAHWRATVWDGDRGIATWVIRDRTEREASQEAMKEIEREWPGRDWTLTQIGKED